MVNVQYEKQCGFANLDYTRWLFLKIKIFHNKHLNNVEHEVNKFLEKLNDVEIIDVKLEVNYPVGTVMSNTMFTVLVMYKK